jgi:hypothetical protein
MGFVCVMLSLVLEIGDQFEMAPCWYSSRMVQQLHIRRFIKAFGSKRLQ